MCTSTTPTRTTIVLPTPICRDAFESGPRTECLRLLHDGRLLCRCLDRRIRAHLTAIPNCQHRSAQRPGVSSTPSISIFLFTIGLVKDGSFHKIAEYSRSTTVFGGGLTITRPRRKNTRIYGSTSMLVRGHRTSSYFLLRFTLYLTKVFAQLYRFLIPLRLEY